MHGWFQTKRNTGSEASQASVRQLPAGVLPNDLAMRTGGLGKTVVWKDRGSLDKDLGRGAAARIGAAIDWASEKVVLVSWTTAGPPEGRLVFRIAGGTRARRVEFFVKAPANARVRGMMARLGADCFVVPRGWSVVFDPRERP